MANLPQSFTMNDASFGTLSPGASSSQSAANKINMASAEQLVLELSNPDLRENALRVLSKATIAILHQQHQGFRSLRNYTAIAIAAVLTAISRNIKDRDVNRTNLFPELAPLLWNSFGTIAAILQEIISTYPVLSPPNLTHVQSTRVCNALALLQCVASHPDTKMPFLKAHIPLYLYPFLNTTNMSGQFEHLRLASLGVIGALVKVNNRDVICFLLSTEIVPLCLRNMEIGREMAKTVATFILQKIVSDDVGLEYVCATAERFFAVERVLKMVMASLENEPSPRLMKLVLPTYYRLSNNRRACDALRSCLPDMLRDANFSSYLREDPTTWMWLQRLLENVGVNRVPSPRAGGGIDHIVAS